MQKEKVNIEAFERIKKTVIDSYVNEYVLMYIKTKTGTYKRYKGYVIRVLFLFYFYLFLNLTITNRPPFFWRVFMLSI